MLFHELIRESCERQIRASPEGKVRMKDLIDNLKSHENASVRLVAGGSNAANRVVQILAVDPHERFDQVREIVRPVDRHWCLSESAKSSATE